MCSSPPVTAPKLQLAVEQLSTGECWNWPKKGTTYPKAKKAQQDGRRGKITIKSNPIPDGWVIHKLENNNTKEVLLLLWRFWTPYQASQPGGLTKRLGIPRESDLEGQKDLIKGIPQAWGKHRLPVLEDRNKILCAQRPGGKQQWLHRKLSQNYLLVLEHLLWRHGSAGAHHRVRGTDSSNPERSSLA